jgi:Ca2+-binding RTX toxin-like protein
MPNIAGTNDADSLVGTVFDDTIIGLAGNDTISGGDGFDRLEGGDGADSIDGGIGDDWLSGGENNDWLSGGDGADRLSGDRANDTILGGASDDFLFGGDGDDSLLGGDGNDYLDGQASGGDTLDGGLGDDILRFTTSRTDGFRAGVVTGGAGADTFQLEIISVVGSMVRLGAGQQCLITDFVTSGVEADKIAFANVEQITNFGRQSFIFAGEWVGGSLTMGAAFSTDFNGLIAQAVTLRDVAANRTYLITDSDSNGTLSARDEVIAFAGAPVLSDSSFSQGLSTNVRLGTNGADNFAVTTTNWEALFGFEGNDTLSGNDGDDKLSGGFGNDSLSGGLGRDTIMGGAGDDTLNGGGYGDVLIDASGNNVIIGGWDYDTFDMTGNTTSFLFNYAWIAGGASFQLGSNQLLEIENVIFGAGNDTLIGTANIDIIRGGAGDDVIFGDAGNDLLIGGRGSDVIVGGTGNDQISVGPDPEIGSPPTVFSNELSYAYGGEGDDSIRDWSLGGNVLLGDAGNDTIIDSWGSFSYMYGGAGNNVMESRALINVFLSEGLFDRMIGDNACFYYRVAGGNSLVMGGSGVDQFVGGAAASNDAVSGGGGADYLYGGNGDDILSGGAGNDVLLGQGGNDTLEGGAGVNLLWANDTGSDQVLVNVADVGTQVLEFFEAGGTNDVVRLLGSSLTSFAGIQNLINNIGVTISGNLMVNAGSGAQLYLNVGANQTAIWFQGVSAYSLTSGDFLFA